MKHSNTTMFVVIVCGIGMALGISPDIYAAGPGSNPQQSGFETEFFSSASNCSECHDNINDQDGEDVSIVKDWQGSLMAYSFVDPLWQAKVASERARLPHLDSMIQEKCVRCHGGMASVEALDDGQPVVLFDDGFTDPNHPLHEIAKEGTSCTLCHQIKDAPELGTDEGASGHYSIGKFSNPRDREIYGQFDGVFTQSMTGSVLYTPRYKEHISQSKVCATCHELKTDYVDQFGNVVSESLPLFPEQMPYSEWEESDFGPGGDSFTSCQACHFKQAQGVRMARSPRWLTSRDQFSTHSIPTENTTILRILDRFSDELGISNEGIEEAISEAGAYLAGAGSVEFVSAQLSDQQLEFQVRVSNLIGHKVPTSIPIRRVYLHTTVRSPSGAIEFESGRLNPDHSIEGVDADSDPSTFEPHWEVITDPSQVQVYEGIMGTYEGGTTYTLLRASHFIKDNRLLPSGFDKFDAEPDVRPAGDCLGDDNFTGGSDLVTYKIDGLGASRYVIEIELLDQSMSFAFIEDLLTDSSDPVVDRFGQMFASAPAETGLIATETMTVTR